MWWPLTSCRWVARVSLVLNDCRGHEEFFLTSLSFVVA